MLQKACASFFPFLIYCWEFAAASRLPWLPWASSIPSSWPSSSVAAKSAFSKLSAPPTAMSNNCSLSKQASWDLPEACWEGIAFDASGGRSGLEKEEKMKNGKEKKADPFREKRPLRPPRSGWQIPGLRDINGVPGL